MGAVELALALTLGQNGASDAPFSNEKALNLLIAIYQYLRTTKRSDGSFDREAARDFSRYLLGLCTWLCYACPFGDGNTMTQHHFTLTSEYIELHSLLKFLGIAPSGGAAKVMVAEGLVSVDGVPESRKTRKLHAGVIVRVGDEEIHILAP